MKADDAPLKSGPFTGRTLKWIFFNEPAYARVLMSGNVEDLTPGQQLHLKSLIARATNLKLGTCRKCKTRPVTRMGITCTPSNSIDQVYFVCGECDYSSRPERRFLTPSLLLPEQLESKGAYGLLRTAIKEARFGDRKKRMTTLALNELFTDPTNKLLGKKRVNLDA